MALHGSDMYILVAGQHHFCLQNHFWLPSKESDYTRICSSSCVNLWVPMHAHGGYRGLWWQYPMHACAAHHPLHYFYNAACFSLTAFNST